MAIGSDHRADLVVRQGHQQWFVDVTVTCPATAAQVANDAHVKHSVAAAASYQRKLVKYAPVLGVVRPAGSTADIPGFVPFVIETGGRVYQRSVQWLDQLLRDSPAVLRRCYTLLMTTLARHQGAMMAKYLNTL